MAKVKFTTSIAGEKYAYRCNQVVDSSELNKVELQRFLDRGIVVPHKDEERAVKTDKTEKRAPAKKKPVKKAPVKKAAKKAESKPAGMTTENSSPIVK